YFANINDVKKAGRGKADAAKHHELSRINTSVAGSRHGWRDAEEFVVSFLIGGGTQPLGSTDSRQNWKYGRELSNETSGVVRYCAYGDRRLDRRRIEAWKGKRAGQNGPQDLHIGRHGGCDRSSHGGPVGPARIRIPKVPRANDRRSECGYRRRLGGGRNRVRRPRLPRQRRKAAA